MDLAIDLHEDYVSYTVEIVTEKIILSVENKNFFWEKEEWGKFIKRDRKEKQLIAKLSIEINK